VQAKPPVTVGPAAVCVADVLARPVQVPDPSTTPSVPVTAADPLVGKDDAVVRTHQVAWAPPSSVPEMRGGEAQVPETDPEPTDVVAEQVDEEVLQATTLVAPARERSAVVDAAAETVPVHGLDPEPVLVTTTVAVRLGLCDETAPASWSKPVLVTATVAARTDVLVVAVDAQSAWPAVAPAPTRRTVSPTRSPARARPRGRRVRVTRPPACR
jgi:hypothetical protein